MAEPYVLKRARRWLSLILGAVVVALLPWTAYLSATLPGEHVTHHWDLAWAGFDLFEASVLAATLIAFLKESQWVALLAASAGTTLLCDAWFDLVTAGSGRELSWALGEAIGGELPLAILCFWLSGEATGGSVSDDPASEADPRPTAPRDPRGEGQARAGTPGSAAPSEGRTSR